MLNLIFSFVNDRKLHWLFIVQNIRESIVIDCKSRDRVGWRGGSFWLVSRCKRYSLRTALLSARDPEIRSFLYFRLREILSCSGFTERLFIAGWGERCIPYRESYRRPLFKSRLHAHWDIPSSQIREWCLWMCS